MESPIPALEIVAHRGASFDAPENTLAAVALAWQQQSDAVEIDVRVTKDQKIVAMHDADTQRTCDGSLVVADTTYAEIQKLDASIEKMTAACVSKLRLVLLNGVF